TLAEQSGGDRSHKPDDSNRRTGRIHALFPVRCPYRMEDRPTRRDTGAHWRPQLQATLSPLALFGGTQPLAGHWRGTACLVLICISIHLYIECLSGIFIGFHGGWNADRPYPHISGGCGV